MSTLRADRPRRRAGNSSILPLFLCLAGVVPNSLQADPLDTGLPPDTTAARKTLAQLGPRFGARYTPHFTLLSDSDRSEPLGGLAEETWSRVNRFATRLRLATRPPAKKLLVIFFDTWEGYERLLRPGGFVIDPQVPGFFDQMSNRCIMFNSADGPLIREKRREITTASSGEAPTTSRAGMDHAQRAITEHEQIINDTVFRHELAHLVLFNIGVQTPDMRDRRWLQEGLAMQFEAPTVVNRYRAADFLALDVETTLALCRSLISDPTPLAPGAQNSAQAYSAAWAVVFFLSSEHPQLFALYLTAPALPRDRELAAFEESFGPLDVAFVERCQKTIADAQSAR